MRPCPASPRRLSWLLPLLPLLVALPAGGADAPPAAVAPPAVVAPPAAAQTPAKAPSAQSLVEQLRVVCLQPSAFSPAAMRYPLSLDPAGALRRARAEAEERPTEAEVRLRVARLAEEVDDENAPREWQVVLGLTEAALKSRPDDVELRERQVESLIGAGVGTRAVAAAERLAAALPNSWRAHLLLGDARVCRADTNWRAVTRLAMADKAQDSPQLAELNADLTGAEQEYARSVQLAPAEGAPRGARIALALSRPMMSSLLLAGLLPGPERTDLAAIRADLLEWVERSSGQIAALWHLAHFFATHSAAGPAPTDAEVQAFDKAAQRSTTEGKMAELLLEARGMLAVARGDWAAARAHLEAALHALPERRIATGWLAVAETRSQEPLAARMERVRARPGAATRPDDQTALGVLLAATDTEAAIETLRGALKLDVAHVGARYALAVLLLQRQPDSSEARHHLDEVWRALPEDPEAAFTFFVARLMDGELAPSRQALKEMARLQPLSPDLRARVEAVLASGQ